jgi:hypothetical protein
MSKPSDLVQGTLDMLLLRSAREILFADCSGGDSSKKKQITGAGFRAPFRG